MQGAAIMSVRLPKYRHHKGSGQALVVIKDQRIYLGKYNSPESKEKYRRCIAQLLSPSPQIEGPQSEESPTINSLILGYYRYAQTYYVKNGKPTDEVYGIRATLSRLRKLYGKSIAKDFGPKAFKLVREAMIQEELSRKYINDSMARIRRMFKWGVAEELLPPSIPQALESVPGLRKGRSKATEGRPIQPLPDYTLEATLHYLPPIVADMVQLQRLIGCRPEEVCALRPYDLDRSGDVWIYQPESHKTEHHHRKRLIFVGPKAQEVILRYLARDAQAHCFRPCDSEAKRLAENERNRKTPRSCGNVRGSNVKSKPKRKPGTKYTSDSYRRAIHRACDKAGIDRWSPNRLRHSTATEVRREFGLEGAQIILGHASADVSQVYAERDIAKGVEIARKIG
jgi:integrase